MNITLDQVRAFEATIRLGTIQKAAKALNKGHSAILYLIRSLEEQLDLNLFDRSGYRNRITPHGEVVLRYCRNLLATRDELEMVCTRLKGGWEPSVKLIYDGVVDFNLIADALFALSRAQLPTEVKIQAAFLREVEQRFVEENADIMVTILPIQLEGIVSISLKPIQMLLVAHKNHPLARKGRRKIPLEELKLNTFIRVRDTSGHLGLSTDGGEFNSTIVVNDFPTKREAIMRQLGFGWLPAYIVQRELKNHSLRILNTEMENQSELRPRLYHRKQELTGKATRQLISQFR